MNVKLPDGAIEQAVAAAVSAALQSYEVGAAMHLAVSEAMRDSGIPAQMCAAVRNAVTEQGTAAVAAAVASVLPAMREALSEIVLRSCAEMLLVSRMPPDEFWTAAERKARLWEIIREIKK